MPATVLYMSMSLDGFITGPDDDVGQGLGSGGERLHDWLGDGGDGVSGFRPSGPSGEIFDELMATGAVVVGRRTFDLAGGWNGDHHGVPIFVLTRREPEGGTAEWPLVTYISDVATAMARAKEAAGDKDVLVHGARTAQLALAAGVLDELEIHLRPPSTPDARGLRGQARGADRGARRARPGRRADRSGGGLPRRRPAAGRRRRGRCRARGPRAGSWGASHGPLSPRRVRAPTTAGARVRQPRRGAIRRGVAAIGDLFATPLPPSAPGSPARPAR